MEAHAVQHTTMWLKGDSVVQLTVDHWLECKLERVRPTITVVAEQLYEQVMLMNAPLVQVQTDLAQFSLEGIGALEVLAYAPRAPGFIETVKEAVKNAKQCEETNSIYEQCKLLIQQGKLM